MSNSIPPLMCCTPPPIDFRDNNEVDEDEFGSFESADIQYEHYNNEPNNLSVSSKLASCIDSTPVNKTGPSQFVPNKDIDIQGAKIVAENIKKMESDTEHEPEQEQEQVDLEISDRVDDVGSDKNLEYYENITSETSNSSNAGGENDFLRKENNVDSIQDVSTRSSREGSLQSLELYIDNMSDGDEDDEKSDSDYQDYDGRIPNCDDNISLPSLKLDSLGLSKNPTPTFDHRYVEGAESSNREKNCDDLSNGDSNNDENNKTSTEEANFAAFENFTWENVSHPSDQTTSDAKTQNNTLNIAQASNTNNLSNSILNTLDTESEFGDFSNANFGEDEKEIFNTKGSIDDLCEKLTSYPVQEDDEFDGFTDFQTCSNVVKPEVKLVDLNQQFTQILKLLFPCSDVINEGEESHIATLKTNVALAVNELDAAKALDYQWKKSHIKDSLIRSLGIDPRNVLYNGERWNTNMPRFAANLGLEPLKPQTQDNIPSYNKNYDKSSDISCSKNLDPTKAEVPHVQFDWNSSGLVNPLDGIKEILHERKAEEILSTEFSEPKEIKSSIEIGTTVGDDDGHKSPPTALTNNESYGCATSTNEKHIINRQQEETKISQDFTPSPTPTSYIVPLKETHIFAPKIEDTNINKEVKPSTNKRPVDFDYEIAATGIIIDEQVVKKEYRDVEYNPSKLVNNLELEDCKSLSNFNDDKKVVKDESFASGLYKTDDKNITAQDIVLDAFWKDTNKEMGTSSFKNSKLYQETETPASQTKFVHQNEVKIDKYLSNENNVISYTSSRNNYEDASSVANESDEFSDFQSSVPINSNLSDTNFSSHYKPQKTSKNVVSTNSNCSPFNNETVLSPSILMPQTSQTFCMQSPMITCNVTKICKNNFESNSNISSVVNNKHDDDDDWNDFVSGPSNVETTCSSTQFNNFQTTEPSNLLPKNETVDENDWSDFIGSFPTTNLKPKTVNQDMVWDVGSSSKSGPQFISWNQPNLPPTVYSSQILQPIRESADQSNSLYSGSHQDTYSIPKPNKTVPSQINMYSSQKQNILLNSKQPFALNARKNEPKISLIPDLKFAEPRNFVNPSKSNFIRK